MRFFANLAFALSLTLSFISPSIAHAHQGRRHHVHRQADLARRDPGEVNLYKRFDNARFTYYAVGLGSCGQTNQQSDFIVALNSAQYNGGQYCFQMITITANGLTTQAQIMDECPGCPYAGLDFSQGLFEFFADISAGVVTGSWDFDSGGSSPSSPSPSPSPSPAPSPSPSPSPSPTPTSVYVPSTTSIPLPTTTSQPPPPTTTSAPPTTSSSSSTSTAVSSSTSSLVPTQTTTNVVAVSAGAVPAGTANSSNLFDLTSTAVFLGEFLYTCSGLQ